MRENVINLKVVLANGDVVKTASRARKSSAGYDLTRLVIGSEGTLGVITEVTLRLQKIPQYSVRVKALHMEDMDVVVEPGIGWMELNEYLEPFGLFFPLDPGPGATIGGMCATRCSGSLAVSM